MTYGKKILPVSIYLFAKHIEKKKVEGFIKKRRQYLNNKKSADSIEFQ